MPRFVTVGWVGRLSSSGRYTSVCTRTDGLAGKMETGFMHPALQAARSMQWSPSHCLQPWLLQHLVEDYTTTPGDLRVKE